MLALTFLRAGAALLLVCDDDVAGAAGGDHAGQLPHHRPRHPQASQDIQHFQQGKTKSIRISM